MQIQNAEEKYKIQIQNRNSKLDESHSVECTFIY